MCGVAGSVVVVDVVVVAGVGVGVVGVGVVVGVAVVFGVVVVVVVVVGICVVKNLLPPSPRRASPAPGLRRCAQPRQRVLGFASRRTGTRGSQQAQRARSSPQADSSAWLRSA